MPILSHRRLLPQKKAAAKLDNRTVENCTSEQDIIYKLLLSERSGYNRHKKPSNLVSVRVEIWVQEVTSVSELTQDFKISEFMAIVYKSLKFPLNILCM